jgi:hypothetical protein
MAATEPNASPEPEPLDEAAAERRLQLEDDHEALLLVVMALEEEWLLDDRIAFSLRHQA